MKKVFLLTFALILAITFSCQDNESKVEPAINYDAFAVKLKSNLNQIAENLRNQQSNFSNPELVTLSARDVLQVNYHSDQATLTAFEEQFFRSSSMVGTSNTRTTSETVYLSEFQYNIVSKVDELWANVTGPSDYKEKLYELFDEVSGIDVESSEKQTGLIYLVSQVVVIDFIINNYDIINSFTTINSNGRTSQDQCESQPSLPECQESWWDSWGQCAAGIIGGTAGGALAGATYGGAGCTVILPIIGTVACGTVGAIVGGIAGGLVASSNGVCSGAGGSGCGQPKCPQYECFACEQE